MINVEGWRALPLGLILLIAVVLLSVWWRQQSYRWVLVIALVAVAAPATSSWSGNAFEVPDYRAGCDGICPGYKGAPVPVYVSDGSGYEFSPRGFALNTLAYAAVFLSWGALVHALLRRVVESSRRANIGRTVLGAGLVIAPLALSPWFLPAPEAHVRGDSLRVAINAQREVYMYDQESPLPVLHVALDDVRPRPDGQAGMRVCLRTYTLFYLPAGRLFLDMTQEGVHSNGGGYLPLEESCWE